MSGADDMPRLHPREQQTLRAELAIREAVRKVIEEFELTDGEAVRVVTEALAGWLGHFAKWMIRHERHPEAPTRPGGLEG